MSRGSIAAMAFTDLPDSWPSEPITGHARLPDVLDLVVSQQARRKGSLYLLLCDAAERLVLPMQISDLDPAPSGRDRAHLLTALLAQLADVEPDASVLAAIARPGGLSATDDDQAWADALRGAVPGRARLLGVHVVTADGSRPVPSRHRAAGSDTSDST